MLKNSSEIAHNITDFISKITSMPNDKKSFLTAWGWLELHEARTSARNMSRIAKIMSARWDAMSELERHRVANAIVASNYNSKAVSPHLIGFNSYSTLFEIVRDLNSKFVKPIGSKKPSRLICINPKDYSDPEVIDSIEVQLRRHGPENCLITTTESGLHMVIEHYPIDTLVPIGHGFHREKAAQFYCGPITGLHDTVVARWADIIEKHAKIKHIRITSCLYGKTNENFEPLRACIKYKEDNIHTVANGRASAKIAYYDPHAPIPFASDSFAGMLWRALDKRGRLENFALSATPMILNPHLPQRGPGFFAACDNDHYSRDGSSIKTPMWRDSEQLGLSRLDKLKSITLATTDSAKAPYSEASNSPRLTRSSPTA